MKLLFFQFVTVVVCRCLLLPFLCKFLWVCPDFSVHFFDQESVNSVNTELTQSTDTHTSNRNTIDKNATKNCQNATLPRFGQHDVCICSNTGLHVKTQPVFSQNATPELNTKRNSTPFSKRNLTLSQNATLKIFGHKFVLLKKRYRSSKKRQNATFSLHKIQHQSWPENATPAWPHKTI